MDPSTVYLAGALARPESLADFDRLLLCGRMCEDMHMATNLAINPELLTRALRLSGEKTNTAAVTLALHEFVARREQSRLLDLFGSLEWDPEFDYKAERSRS